MHEDIAMISSMIEAGASGYILKRSNMNDILEAIRVVAEHGKYLGRDVQSIVMDNLGSRDSENELPSNTPASLTSRENEILKLIAKELSNEEIANKLFISERTVETHRRNIFTKTKTKSIVGLIKYAIKYGFVSQDNDQAKTSR
jgi:DNA-binding NarL/FixJ family response regulator